MKKDELSVTRYIILYKQTYYICIDNISDKPGN